ncbi:MAG: hypothetical protein NG740_04830 [Omnitrophica bacterium]|nr:hypothetical protein [Candidatus Omnitrophota bacterium]
MIPGAAILTSANSGRRRYGKDTLLHSPAGVDLRSKFRNAPGTMPAYRQVGLPTGLARKVILPTHPGKGRGVLRALRKFRPKIHSYRRTV